MQSYILLSFAPLEFTLGKLTMNLWFIVEIFIIFGVVVFQFLRSKEIYERINQLEEIFQYPLKVRSGIIEKERLEKELENSINEIEYDGNSLESKTNTNKNIVSVSIVETSGKNTSITRIKDAINTYLLSNYGLAVNFSIIKDIIDREIDVQDEEISQDIPTPLYLGLAATMIGIIFGLLSMPSLKENYFSEGIEALINGVKVAMSASLIGLGCTTYLSSFHYKKAKKITLVNKNSQISYLQAQLLPKLIRAEDTGIFGLIGSLDRFTKVATKISDDVLIAANQTGENIVMQQEVLDKVSNLDIIRISETNLELFKRLEDNIGAFHKFSEYISALSQISNNLREFSSRTIDINRVVNKIDTGLDDNSRLTRFLSEHFEKIETIGNTALKAVDLSDSMFKEAMEHLREETEKFVDQTLQAVNLSSSHFTSAIEKLKEETDKRIAQLNRDASNNEMQLKEIYDDIGVKLSSITVQHLNQLQSAYTSAIPQFNHLSNLQILPKIQEDVASGVIQIQSETTSNAFKLIEKLSVLNNSLNDGISTISNNGILSKLERIETNYHKQISDGMEQLEAISNANTEKLIGAIRELRNAIQLRYSSPASTKSNENHNLPKEQDLDTEERKEPNLGSKPIKTTRPGFLKRLLYR